MKNRNLFLAVIFLLGLISCEKEFIEPELIATEDCEDGLILVCDWEGICNFEPCREIDQ